MVKKKKWELSAAEDVATTGFGPDPGASAAAEPASPAAQASSLRDAPAEVRLLAVFLPLVCFAALIALPSLWPASQDAGASRVLTLALLAGVVGSSIHALQSLAAFVGNRCFEPSWTLWYLFRPLVGGALGLVTALVLYAGLASGAGNVNPYGLTAAGGLAGLFSKQAVDKLEEVFDTIFRRKDPVEYRDRLDGDANP